MRKLFTNKFLASLSGLLVIASTVFALTGTSLTASAAIDDTPDCDNVAIIKCGAFSESALKAAYDKNTTGDLKKVYDEFGISRSDMTGFESGIVYRNGNVTVGGKVVATDAMTAGRNFGGTPISGTKNVGKYSVSKFVDEGQTAFVKMNDGKFEFAIVKACGNPVTAKPKETPKPKPTFVCDTLTIKKISRTEYQFTASGSAGNGAKVTGYRFTFSDGQTETITSRTITHTFTDEGRFSAKVEIRVDVDGTTKYVSGSDCVVTGSVTPQPTPHKVEVCNPANGQIIIVDEKDAGKYKPVGDAACESIKVCRLSDKVIVTIRESQFDESKYSKNLEDCKEQVKGEEAPQVIAHTGPSDFIAGGLGLGSLTAAGYYLRASRRNLVEKFLNR